MTRGKTASLLLALMLCAATLAGCSRDDPVLVALLLPHANAERWHAIDEPTFEARVAQTCRGCEFRAYSAEGDADRQQRQFDEAVADGADVLVVAAVDPPAAQDWLVDLEVPVVAYDRFIDGADYYVSHDTARIGELQAEALVAGLDGRGRILMVHGGRDDPNAAAIKATARAGIADSGLEIVDEVDPPDWSADEARAWVGAVLEREGAGSIDGIYAANDVQAGGVAQALTDAGVAAKDFPVITGQDAELDAVRRMVLGEQSMTVMKQIRAQAERSADLAVAILTGSEVESGDPYDGVPAWILEPQAVTVAEISNTVVRQGQLRTKDICAGETEKRCARLGLR